LAFNIYETQEILTAICLWQWKNSAARAAIELKIKGCFSGAVCGSVYHVWWCSIATHDG